MPVVINPPALTPPPQFPYKYGPLDLHLSTRQLDGHAWISADADGGVVALPEACTFPATPHVFSICDSPELKSTPQSAVRPALTASPRYFEAAAKCATLGVPDATIEAVAKRSVQSSLELALDTEIATALDTAAVPGAHQPSLWCAVSAAISALAATEGDGRGLITLSPGAAFQLLQGHAINQTNNRLEDYAGNVYRVLRTFATPNQNTLYYESEASYEIWLDSPEPQILPIPADEIARRNDRIVRAEQGYILWSARCGVGSITFDCVGL